MITCEDQIWQRLVRNQCSEFLFQKVLPRFILYLLFRNSETCSYINQCGISIPDS